MKPFNRDENIVPFKGAKLNNFTANQAGVGIFGGIIGVLFALIIFGTDHKIYSLIIVCIFAGLGFFGYGFLKQLKIQKRT